MLPIIAPIISGSSHTAAFGGKTKLLKEWKEYSFTLPKLEAPFFAPIFDVSNK